MKQPIVADSTCLIGLERIGQLDLLSELFEPLCIPPEVDRPISWGMTLTRRPQAAGLIGSTS